MRRPESTVGWLVLAAALATLGVAVAAMFWTQPATPLPAAVRSVQVLGPDGAATEVGLPDTLEGSGIVHRRYRWRSDLGVSPRGLALYASGLSGVARFAINGQLLFDEIGQADAGLPPRPRGAGTLRLVALPDALLRPGSNEFELDVAARRRVSTSELRIGEHAALESLRSRKVTLLVTGPMLVATLIGGLGCGVLMLWARRRDERQYLWFAIAAIGWAVHTLWTVAPSVVLPAPHAGVWWTTLYALIVAMLVMFALRFAQRGRRAWELRTLWALATLPALLYGANAIGRLDLASDVLRLVLVVAAFGGLAVVAHHAWHRRSASSALLVVAGLGCAGFGLRDWLVAIGGKDNNPIWLTPYGAAPFMLLVSWLFADRFVRTADALEDLNARLEERVALRERELAAGFAQQHDIERQQATLDERQRMLRELHDGLGARLLATRLRIAEDSLDSAGIADELDACLADMRLASEALGAESTELGAVMANFLLRWDRLLRDAQVHPDWRIALPDAGLPVAPYVALQLLRVLQEAMSNVLRHAHAAAVQLTLHVSAATLVASVEDDGCGIAPEAAPARGMARMRARAEAIGATLALSTPPGGGTRVELRLPLIQP